jgi:hypothetical protein
VPTATVFDEGVKAKFFIHTSLVPGVDPVVVVVVVVVVGVPSLLLLQLFAIMSVEKNIIINQAFESGFKVFIIFNFNIIYSYGFSNLPRFLKWYLDSPF